MGKQKRDKWTAGNRIHIYMNDTELPRGRRRKRFGGTREHCTKYATMRDLASFGRYNLICGTTCLSPLFFDTMRHEVTSVLSPEIIS